MNRGQVISGDFIVSISVFLLVLAIIIPAFLKLSEANYEKQRDEEMRTRAFFIADSILKTEGVPKNWNYTNVNSIGLSDENGRINKTKFRNLMRINSSGARALLGLGYFNLNISLYSGNYYLMTGAASSPAAYFYVNDNSMLRIINNSGLAWDLYYGGAGTPATGDSRNAYSGEKSFLFNQLLLNSTKYKTIIIENPELTQAEVNINDLKDFVATGGIIIYEGEPQLISEGFSMHAATDTGKNGISKDGGLIDEPDGSMIMFNNSLWYFYRDTGDSELHVAAEDQLIANAAFIGYWNHGIGMIYYITDAEGTVNGQDLLGKVNLVGSKAEFYTGFIQNMVSNTRAVMFDADLNSLGRATVVVG